MNAKKAAEILQRYRQGDASSKEIEMVEHWYTNLADKGDWHWQQGEKEILESDIEKGLLQSINKYDKGTKTFGKIRLFKLARWAAAAIIILSFGVWQYSTFRDKPVADIKITRQEKLSNDVLPGKNGAILVLGNGQKIILDSTSGSFGKQGNSSLVNDNGKLSYTPLNEKPTEIFYNTLTTQRGNQYELVLPDGSHVWLNAASSITYPTAFIGNERKVNITGEAYFEITKNIKLPFIVQKGDMSIKVLGTHFNVKAYSDEDALKTTLLEGSIEILIGNNKSLIKPGQQAILNNNSNHLQVINDANIEETMAWKNGVFKFSNAGIESIMVQISRWYDVDVVYKTKVTHHFVAEIPRNVPVSELLRLLELTDQVHFKIEGKKIIVIP